MKSLKEVLILSTGLLVVIATIGTGIVMFVTSGISTKEIVEAQFTDTLKGAGNILKYCLYEEYGSINLENGAFVDSDGELIDIENNILDEFSESMNMVATLFIKEGSDFIRTMTTVTNSDGTRAVDTELDTTSAAYKAITNNQDYYGDATILGEDYFTYYSPKLGGNNEIIGIYFVGIPISDIATLIDNANEKTLTTSLIYSIPLLLFSFIITYIISSILVKKLKAITVAAQKIAEGNFDVDISIKSNSEIGQLAVAFKHTIKQLINYQGYIDEIGTALKDIAEGQLNVTLKKQYVGQFEGLKVNLENLLTHLTSTMVDIRETSQKIHRGATQMSNGAIVLSEGATEQDATIEALALNIARISDHLTVNASSTDEAKHKTVNVDEYATTSINQMNEMTTAINDISEKSNQIATLVKAIDTIAFQTNILALNASVESARAGVAGKGFAVVANEVRSLATKSAETAKYMADLIAETLSAVNKGTVMAADTSMAIKSLVESTKSVNTLIDVISDSSKEQVLLVSDVNIGVQEIVTVVHANALSAQESTNVSEDLLKQSNTLTTLISKFKFS